MKSFKEQQVKATSVLQYHVLLRTLVNISIIHSDSYELREIELRFLLSIKNTMMNRVDTQVWKYRLIKHKHKINRNTSRTLWVSTGCSCDPSPCTSVPHSLRAPLHLSRNPASSSLSLNLSDCCASPSLSRKLWWIFPPGKFDAE
jgi:hypothetical protein